MIKHLLIFLLLPSLLYAANNANLSWDASPSPDVTGYVIYYGQEQPPATATGPQDYVFPYRQVVDGRVLTIKNLAPGKWYFVATAYTPVGESAYSNIVSKEFATYVPTDVDHPEVTIPLPPGGTITININVGP